LLFAHKITEKICFAQKNFIFLLRSKINNTRNMEFKKYSSIENSFNTEFVEQVRASVPADLRFVVQEKVHGSNTSFITDGKEIKFAKRTDYIADGEKFFDYEELLDRYTPKVKQLYAALHQKYPQMDFAIIYGEMFGGAYPHKDIKKDTRFSTIQKGVYYCPNHEFYGFDIYVSEPSGKHYLSVEETNKFFEDNGFLYAKTLFEGTLDECLAYPNKFPSQISQWLGYPPIEDNVCEGVVIRPVVPTYIGYGDRVLIKNKNERFAEKKGYKKHPKVPKEDPVYSDNLNALIAKGSLYVTENRLNNVISHIGQVSMPKDLGKLIGLFSKDILDDFIKESSADYNNLEKPEQKILNKEINQMATTLIKKTYKIIP